jgi:NhaP-type Na+/H+ or K+/H+ antiporter
MSTEAIVVQLTAVIAIGMAAEWLAWRVGVPSIPLLLLFGIVAGPVLGLVQPDRLLGNLLLPAVSLVVAIVLFEGSLKLKIAELFEVGGVVRNLLSVGVFINWAVAAATMYKLLGLSPVVSVLGGAVLVITGPTAVTPLLLHLRADRRIAAVLRWEGMVLGPLGALLALLIFEGVVAGSVREATAFVAAAVAKTIMFGGAIGMLGAGLLVLLLKRYWLPDFLHGTGAVVVALGVFAACDVLQRDSGLVAAVVMGVALANQKSVSIRYITEFMEHIGVLLISALFVLLAARMSRADLTTVAVDGLVLVAMLVLVARPLSVSLSTLRSGLSWKQKLFVSAVAPRGIVAATVASVLALRLGKTPYSEAGLLGPLVLVVVGGTVLVYGLSAAPLARWLGLAEPAPQGVLIAGGNRPARQIASALHREGYHVLVVDSNRAHVLAARRAGLPTHHARALSPQFLEDVDLAGMGRLLALDPDDERNCLAVLQLLPVFGRSEVYRLPTTADGDEGEPVSPRLRGRTLFRPDMSYDKLADYLEHGAIIKTTPLTDEFDYRAFQEHYGGTAIPLFVISARGRLSVVTADTRANPKAGDKIISLVKAHPDV